MTDFEGNNVLPVDSDNHGDDHANTAGGDGELVEADVVDGNGVLPDQLKRVYNSARWVPSQNTRIQYPTPRELIDPMLDAIARKGLTGEFNVHTTDARTVQENSSDEQHTAYGKVLAECEFGDYTRHDTIKTVGLVYDLTRKSPTIKTYAGHNVRACVNLMVFDATNVFEGDLLSGGEVQAEEHIQSYLTDLPASEDEFVTQVDRLKSTRLGEDELNQLLGYMLREVHSSSTFGAATLNYAVKLMDDSNSRYALDGDGSTTAWNVLQALTQFVTDRKKDSAPHLVPTKSLQIGSHIADTFLN